MFDNHFAGGGFCLRPNLGLINLGVADMCDKLWLT